MSGRPAAPLVLIVEDEFLIARNIARHLSHLDYEVVGICASAAEVMGLVRQRRPDVVLMDIRIDGGEDGIALAERLWDMLGIPVVYLSALLDDATLERVKASRPFGFVAKPFSQRELQMALEIALHKSAEEKRLTDREVSLSRLIEGMPQGFCLVDEGLRIRYANQAFGALLARSPAELQGQSVAAWVNLPADEGDAPAARAWREQRPFETLAFPAGGKELSVLVTVQHLADSGGRRTGSFLSFTELAQVVRDPVAPAARTNELGTER